jgi:hypothetical protein
VQGALLNYTTLPIYVVPTMGYVDANGVLQSAQVSQVNGGSALTASINAYPQNPSDAAAITALY